MTYSSDRRQPKSSIAQAVAQRAGAASFVDKRASTAAQLQLKQKIDDRQNGGASQSITQMAASENAKSNDTGLPDKLKSGIESLSGLSMDHVKVRYNSAQPAQLNAHAYAQGSQIHVAPGQERHLPHEAWHVVQQAQGRVKPTVQLKEGHAINDNKELEAEADAMGAKAARQNQGSPDAISAALPAQLAEEENQRWFDSDVSQLATLTAHMPGLDQNDDEESDGEEEKEEHRDDDEVTDDEEEEEEEEDEDEDEDEDEEEEEEEEEEEGNRELSVSERNRLANLSRKHKVLSKKLAKKDNSGHGGGKNIPTGHKGDKHQVGQNRKKTRVKNIHKGIDKVADEYKKMGGNPKDLGKKQNRKK